MSKPEELAALTAELRSKIPGCAFRFEWSSPSQKKQLLLCGDWNRCGRRSSRTIKGPDGGAIKRGRYQLDTDQRRFAVETALRLVSAYEEGALTTQRRKPDRFLTSISLKDRKRRVLEMIRERDGGHGAKSKHLRHLRSLFDWLDDRNLLLDCVNAIQWAGDGVKRDTDTYADRLRIAEWSCTVNGVQWVLPPNKRAKKPKVHRPFVDAWVGRNLAELFPLIQDPAAQAFTRVVAATGCRPSEVFCFDWDKWDATGRPSTIDCFSRKIGQPFTALCNPLDWVVGIDVDLLRTSWSDDALRGSDEVVSADLAKRYSRFLRMVQKDLAGVGKPTWTDIRHLWTVRAELNGVNRRIGALMQAHSEKMAAMVYLRHGSRAQVLAEAERIASLRAGGL